MKPPLSCSVSFAVLALSLLAPSCLAQSFGDEGTSGTGTTQNVQKPASPPPPPAVVSGGASAGTTGTASSAHSGDNVHKAAPLNDAPTPPTVAAPIVAANPAGSMGAGIAQTAKAIMDAPTPQNAPAAQSVPVAQNAPAAPLPPQVAALVQSGDQAGAVKAAQAALAQNPGDPGLRAFVELNKKPETARISESTMKQRAQELLAQLRGDPGAAPAAGPVLASPFAAGASAPAAPGGAAAAAAALAAGLGPGGLGRTDALVRDAALKVGLRDYAGADELLTRRLEQAPDDEPALRLRAIVRRSMKRYVPSSEDARAALTLVPRDSRARALYVEDLVDLGRSREAMREADDSLKVEPRDARVLAARADVWASLGERERQVADLREAAALDDQFDALYRQALQPSSGAGGAPASRAPSAFAVWLAAVGICLGFVSYALFRRRGDSSVRLAMRSVDHAVLARGGGPELAPKGFRIERTLGEGGMGIVYEAVDLALQRPVALKKLRAEVADNPRERARFLKEARTVAALRHPNIVAIHAIHEDEEGLFLVFEKVSGVTLHERALQRGLAPAESVGYLRQIAKALDHAHGLGVVHQDLKPANVMVSGDEAKVMDFGIARRVAETLSTLSKIEIAGTPAYMAPEQQTADAVGPAADVYSLGICAYELLTGRRPFPDGGSLMMKVEKVYRPASELGGPAAADAVLARALEPSPGARWPTASSFVEALGRSVAHG